MNQHTAIGVRRTNYACCALGYLHKYSQAARYGDTSCEKNRRLWILMLWGKSVMDRTPQDENEEDNNACVTYDFAKEVMAKLDCFCSSCGCDGVAYPPPPDSCAPSPWVEVIAGVDTGSQATIEAGPPAIGDTYYVITNDSPGITWVINDVVVWNGTGWDVTQNPYMGIVQRNDVSPPEMWTQYNGIPGMLWPPVTLTFTGTGTYDVQSTASQIALFSGRTALIQLFTGGGWITALQIPEADIAAPYSVDLSGFSFTEVGISYVAGDCIWPTTVGTIIPDNCTFPRAHACTSHSTSSHR